jgi:hypothetical protein
MLETERDAARSRGSDVAVAEISTDRNLDCADRSEATLNMQRRLVTP